MAPRTSESGQVAEQIRGDKYTHMLDLHDNLRSRAPRAASLPGHWRGYPKHRMARAAPDPTKRNIYATGGRWRSATSRPPADLDVSARRRPAGVLPRGRRRSEQVGDWLPARARPEPAIVAIGPGGGARHQALAAGALDRSWCRHIRKTGAEVVVVGGPGDRPSWRSAIAKDAGTRSGQRRRKLWPAGDRRPAQASARAHLRRHRRHAHGDRSRDAGGGAVRPHGRAVRILPLQAEAAEVVELTSPCRPCTAQGGTACPLGHHRCMSRYHARRSYTTRFGRRCA